MDFGSSENSICSIFSKASPCVLQNQKIYHATLVDPCQCCRGKFNQFYNFCYIWFCKWRSEYNNKRFQCLKTSNQIINILLYQHVQQLYKLASIKLMKCYLCGGFLIRVESNWCFSHPTLPLEFSRIDLLIHCIMTISFFSNSTVLCMMAIASMMFNSSN